MPLALIIALIVVAVVVFWDVIKKILPILLLVLALAFATGILSFTLFPAGTTLFGIAIGPMVFGGTSAALLAAGASFLLFPDDTAELVSEVSEAVGDAASSVLDTVIDVASGAVTSFLSSPGGLIIAGVAFWYFFLREKKDGDERALQRKDDVVDAQAKVLPDQPSVAAPLRLKEQT